MNMRKIYRQVAKKNGVSIKEIKAGMQAAINEAYLNLPDDGGISDAYRQQIPSKSDIPTPDEFIKYLAGKIENGHN